MNNKGISPLVATVMLVAISVAAAGMVFVWLQGFMGEQTQKNNAPIERSCEQLKYSAEISQEGKLVFLVINNEGNIPIKEVYLKAIKEDGSSSVIERNPLKYSDSHVPAIFAGNVIKLSIDDIWSVNEVVKIDIIPVLYGTGTKSKQPKIGFCPEQKQEIELPRTNLTGTTL